MSQVLHEHMKMSNTCLYILHDSGQANIIIEPGQHQKQYSHLWPFEAGIDVYYQEFEWLR